ncbi:MAG: TPM domain-containing protein [Ruminococcaceae bacterium]|nr:TPM domain-containing protein [Oscillospiraceae bacterium]
MIKRLTVLCLCLGLCLGLAGCGEPAYPDPTQAGYVNDFADVMTPEAEKTIYQAGLALEQQTGAQLVLVTVNDTGSQTLEEYALGMARQWELGDEEKDNGLLLLFTVDGPHSRIEVGYGLEGALPDSKAGRILDDYLVPHYDDRAAWAAALTATYDVCVNEVLAEYGLTKSQYADQPLPAQEQEIGLMEVLAVIIALAVMALLRSKGVHVFPGFFIGGGHRGGGFGGGGGGFRGGGGGFGGGGASR